MPISEPGQNGELVVGQERSFRNRPYVFDGYLPHVTLRGATTNLERWAGTCARCNRPFLHTCRLGDKPSAFCEAHRKRPASYGPKARPYRSEPWFEGALLETQTLPAFGDLPLTKATRSIYVVYLRDPSTSRSGLYVGMTSLRPEERFARHKSGQKASRHVRKHGVCLAPELYEHLNPLPYRLALKVEATLARWLREVVPWVEGGH